MSHVQIVRKTLRFGAVTGPGASGCFAYHGVPGPGHHGGWRYPSQSAAAFAGFQPQGGELSDLAGLKLELPKHRGCPPTAISIAPDSPIHSCNLSFGGRHDDASRHVISPGNPFIGCPDDDFAMVSLVDAIPLISPLSRAIYWDGDASHMENADIEITEVTFPLRLEVWYGALPVRSHWRAPYIAHGAFSGADGFSQQMVVCLQGRRRIEVAAVASDGAATIQCYAGWPKKQEDTSADQLFSSPPLVLDDEGGTTLTVDSSGGGDIIGANAQFFGNGFNIFTVSVAFSGDADNIQVRVTANDE